MISLSDRLQYIADKIKEGETMADIGTDHGFLPVYLAESGRCPRVVMTDVSPSSLEKARATAAQRGFAGGGTGEGQQAKSMDFRVGDGLSVLETYEVDTVVIAGMGGKLIRDIMAEDMELTCSFRKFVLQPRIGQGHLRKWLVENGFVIISEGVVYERRHIPEIITALSPDAALGEKSLTAPYNDLMKQVETGDIRWRVPPWIIYADGPVNAFLMRNTAMEEEKLYNVRRARKRDLKLEEKILQDIEYLKKLRKEDDDGK